MWNTWYQGERHWSIRSFLGCGLWIYYIYTTQKFGGWPWQIPKSKGNLTNSRKVLKAHNIFVNAKGQACGKQKNHPAKEDMCSGISDSWRGSVSHRQQNITPSWFFMTDTHTNQKISKNKELNIARRAPKWLPQRDQGGQGEPHRSPSTSGRLHADPCWWQWRPRVGWHVSFSFWIIVSGSSISWFHPGKKLKMSSKTCQSFPAALARSKSIERHLLLVSHVDSQSILTGKPKASKELATSIWADTSAPPMPEQWLEILIGRPNRDHWRFGNPPTAVVRAFQNLAAHWKARARLGIMLFLALMVSRCCSNLITTRSAFLPNNCVYSGDPNLGSHVGQSWPWAEQYWTERIFIAGNCDPAT